MTARVTIHIHNGTRAHARFNTIIREAVFCSARLLGIKKIFEVSVALVFEQKMRALNRARCGKNSATDVLSFRFMDGKDGDFIQPKEAPMFLGEIVLCPAYAKRQAKRLGISFKKNMAILATHGMVHLCGIDHERSAKEHRKTMEIQEEVVGQMKM